MTLIPVWSHGLRNRPGNLRKKGVGKFGQEQPDGVGAPRHQAASHPVHLIVQLLSAPQYTLAGGRADLPLVSQGLRHRDHGDLQISRYVHHRCAHGGKDTTVYAQSNRLPNV